MCKVELRTQNVGKGSEVDIDFKLTSGSKAVVAARKPGGGKVRISDGGIKRMPLVWYLTSDEHVPSEIDSESLSELQSQFLEIAFGKGGVKKLSESLTDPSLRWAIREANRRINARLDEVFPHTLGLKLNLEVTSREPFRFSVSLTDNNEGDTPIHLRGAGVQKTISLLVKLTSSNLDWQQLYILIDEPENSLHADLQHKLRNMLEELASNEQVQVIYATHSPSMLNPVKTGGLRLLERTNKDGVATTNINNRPYDDNFQRIRSSLGISPADSLLYAPITIIVEGITEMECLPSILWRLHKENVDGFDAIPNLLSLTHILNGFGDSFEFWCRLSKSQGAKPIIFVDGDKIRRVNQASISDRHPDVPILHLDEGKEFEELVESHRYFESLAQLNQNEGITLEAYKSWDENSGLHVKMMFSKRIERWLQDEFEIFDFDKAETMKKALELAWVSEIKLEPFRQLVTTISNQLDSA